MPVMKTPPGFSAGDVEGSLFSLVNPIGVGAGAVRQVSRHRGRSYMNPKDRVDETMFRLDSDTSPLSYYARVTRTGKEPPNVDFLELLPGMEGRARDLNEVRTLFKQFTNKLKETWPDAKQISWYPMHNQASSTGRMATNKGRIRLFEKMFNQKAIPDPRNPNEYLFNIESP